MNMTSKHTSLWLDTVTDIRRYPILAENTTADVVVVGGGIVGVLTAWHLARHGLSVVLLEKNHIGTGDTGLTTGFLTRVPDASLHRLVTIYGIDAVAKFFRETTAAQKQLLDLIEKENIACDLVRCNSYFCSYETDDSTLDAEWNVVKEIDPDSERLKTGTPNPGRDAICFRNEAKFHARKFLFGLLDRAPRGRLTVYEESEVTRVETDPDVKVHTGLGSVTAKKLIIATGMPLEHFEELRPLLTSKLTSVIVARYDRLPISQDVFWDTFDPYFYYRAIDTETLLVGGCDRPPGVSPNEKNPPPQELTRFLDTHLPGYNTITHEWTGSLFYTPDGLPYAFSHPHYNHTVFVATGLGGNGMVCGALLADTIAQLVLGEMPDAAELLSPRRTKATIEKPKPKPRDIPTPKGFIPAATLADFEKKNKRCVIVNGKKIALFKVKDKFFAIDNTCSHAGGSLCEGTIDENIVQCPLHGAKFDVTTGAVVGPPATRGQATYPVRERRGVIEIEISTEEPSTTKPRQTYWRYCFLAAGGAIVFWFLEFLAQYLWISPFDIGTSFVRSFAFAGMTLISLALFSSAIFKWFPRLSDYWRLRRYLGVSGFTLVLFHVFSVYYFYFHLDILAPYYSLNPLKNPIIFGSIAFPIFMIMAMTSTDWALGKLGDRRWKTIHRFVYIAYISSIFHYLTMNPPMLRTVPGIILLVITALALFGQLFWFVKISKEAHFRSWGTIVGSLIILGTILVAYLATRASLFSQL